MIEKSFTNFHLKMKIKIKCNVFEFISTNFDKPKTKLNKRKKEYY